MDNKLRTIRDSLWLKIWHPSVKTNGMHRVRPGTEINIRSGGKLYINRRVDTQRRVTFSVIGGNLTIGNSTSFNRNDIIVCHDLISIGSNCLFGPNVVIYDHDHKFGQAGIATDEFKTTPIIIEDNCWIGANVIILRGTHIGKGSVIGAGTVVKGNIPPYSLVKNSREILIDQITDDSRRIHEDMK